jgi:hypothetical protein
MTHYRLDSPGIKTFMQTGPRGPPRLLYNGYWVSFPQVKQPGHGIDHPHPSSLRLEKEYSNTSTPLWACITCSTVNFTSTFHYYKHIISEVKF